MRAESSIWKSGVFAGVFQLEGAGMRDTLKRMRPNRIEDIIALIAYLQRLGTDIKKQPDTQVVQAQ